MIPLEVPFILSLMRGEQSNDHVRKGKQPTVPLTG